MHLQKEEVILKGNPVCRGIAIGKLFFLKRDEFKIFEQDIRKADTDREVDRYRSALSRSKQDIKRLQKQLEAESAIEGILILDAQLEMLQDPLLTTEIEKEICQTKKNAEFVFQKALLSLQKKFNDIGDAFFTERFKDLKDISGRIFSYLYESGNISLKDLPPNSVVCAQDLTASDAAEATAHYVVAFMTELGGATSHAAIVAKSKGIPFITKIDLQILKEHPEAIVIVDGRTGKVIVNPSVETLKKYEHLKLMMHQQAKSLEKIIHHRPETFDGHAIQLSANLETTHEVDLVRELGGEGIGLFRSEYIFLPQQDIPSEDEQFLIYSYIAERMQDLPVVIRTFDVGGDKVSKHFAFSSDKNAFLGSRATRFFLKEPELLKTQLKAIIRASIHGNVGILFPMISTLSDLRLIKRMIAEVQEELGLMHKVPIGCMIEVPSAAMIADFLAKECDFFSIGTNDLVQYSLAVDRGDQLANEFYEPTDPSILRLIKIITMAAHQEGISVTVCGEIASDPRFTPLLIGLGVHELSVTPRSLPAIKNAIRNTSIVDAVQLADQALELQTSQEVLNLISREYLRMTPQDLFYQGE